MNSEKRTVLKQWFRILIGLVIFAFGVHLTIFANIGLAPWDCLSMGVSYHTPLNYGMSVTLISIVIICIDLLMKERIGFGTIFDALVVGNTIQFFNDHNPFPLNEGILTGIPIMLLGFLFMAIKAADLQVSSLLLSDGTATGLCALSCAGELLRSKLRPRR